MWVRFLLPLLLKNKINKYLKNQKNNNKIIKNKTRVIDIFFKYKKNTPNIKYKNLNKYKNYNNNPFILNSDFFFNFKKTKKILNNYNQNKKLNTHYYYNSIQYLYKFSHKNKINPPFNINLFFVINKNIKTILWTIKKFNGIPLLLNKILLNFYFVNLFLLIKNKNNLQISNKTVKFLNLNKQSFNFNRLESDDQINETKITDINTNINTNVSTNEEIFNKEDSFQNSFYFHYSKFYFLNFNEWAKLKRIKLPSFFKIKKNDWIHAKFCRLTKYSTIFNINSYIEHNFLFKSMLNKPKIIYFNKLIQLKPNILEKNYIFIINKSLKSLKSLKNLPELKLNVRDTNKINFKKYKINKNKNINNLKTLNLFKFNKFEILISVYYKPIFFKYVFSINNKIKINTLNLFNNMTTFFKNYFFHINPFSLNNNLIPHFNFSHIFRKKIIKIFNYDKFPLTTTTWHYNTLIKFLEFFSGKKTYINFFAFLNIKLNFKEKTQCLIWSQRVKYFRKVLGPRLFLNESLQIMYLSLKLKDPYTFSNWIVSTMGKISFWKFKTFLRYIKYVMRYFFWVIFKELAVKGVKFQLKGKVSVAGNARTRTVFHTIGFTSHGTFNNKILYKLNLIKTFTGVLGLKLWIVF